MIRGKPQVNSFARMDSRVQPLPTTAPKGFPGPKPRPPRPAELSEQQELQEVTRRVPHFRSRARQAPGALRLRKLGLAEMPPKLSIPVLPLAKPEAVSKRNQ